MPGVAVTDVEIIFMVDISGSMAAHGRIQSLNGAMEEALPFLQRSAASVVDVRPSARVLTFGSTGRWASETPTPLSEFRWPPLEAEQNGMTELGSGLDLVTRSLDLLDRGRPPALILCSDGMPTDTIRPTFSEALNHFDQHPIGRQASRAAIAIGREADEETLRAFLAPVGGAVLSAQQPQQLAAHIRLAGTSVLESASKVIW